MAALSLVLLDVALPIFSSLLTLLSLASVFYLYRASVLSAGRRNIVVVLSEGGGCYLYLIERECMCASYRPFRLLPLLFPSLGVTVAQRSFRVFPLFVGPP